MKSVTNFFCWSHVVELVGLRMQIYMVAGIINVIIALSSESSWFVAVKNGQFQYKV